MNRTWDVETQGLGTGRPVRLLCFGLGPIGLAAARLAASKPDQFQITGAVDRDPSLAGRPLEALAGVPAPGHVTVRPTLDHWEGQADVAIHSTGSRLSAVADQLMALVDRGLHVVSSCEELFYAYLQSGDLADRLDAAARSRGVTICGAGINPGFLMDVLPKVLALAVGRVDHVACCRVVDARQRRGPLQRKVGAGLSVEEFHRRAEQGSIGHVGLAESAAFLAGELGLAVTSIRETLEPEVAAQAFQTPYVTVEPGQVSGIRHEARALVDGREAIHLLLRIGLGNPDPHDRIVIRGEPSVEFCCRPCVAGDSATAAVLVNLSGRLPEAPRGLRSADEVAMAGHAGRLRVSLR